MGEPVRLQKFLSAAGVCSRRRGERYIQEGRVRVNGAVVTQMGTQVDPDADRVEFDGRPVRAEEKTRYLALHKPRGYVTTCDQPGRDIVLDLVDLPERVYPIGRLDKDSTGLLLLTNDGSLHHRLAHPSFDHEKEYLVTVDRKISDAALQKMADGLPIQGARTRPARVERLGADRFRIILREGRNRQIRRMVGKVGAEVVTLKRIRVGGVRLGGLPEGEWRHLTEAERNTLVRGARKKPSPGNRVQGRRAGTKSAARSARSPKGKTGRRKTR
jgi:23S rRNA pseudouridine2605 synthase/23S rRNA pseudouridine2604 synthase